MECQSGGTRSIIDELHSWDIQGDQMEVESMVLLELSTMKFMLGMAEKTKWKVKVAVLEVSSMNIFLGIYN